MQTKTEDIVKFQNSNLTPFWKRIFIDNEATNYFISRNGIVITENFNKVKVLKQTKKAVYKRSVGICHKGISRSTTVQRLLAEYFVEPPIGIEMKDLEVINEYPKSNRIFCTNLRWAVKKSYSDSVIMKVCEMLDNGERGKDISIKTGVSAGQISLIKNGRSRSNISNISITKRNTVKPFIINFDLNKECIRLNDPRISVDTLMEGFVKNYTEFYGSRLILINKGIPLNFRRGYHRIDPMEIVGEFTVINDTMLDIKMAKAFKHIEKTDPDKYELTGSWVYDNSLGIVSLACIHLGYKQKFLKGRV